MKTVMLKGNIFREPQEFRVLTKEQLDGLCALGLDVRQVAYMELNYRLYAVFTDEGIKYFAVQSRSTVFERMRHYIIED